MRQFWGDVLLMGGCSRMIVSDDCCGRGSGRESGCGHGCNYGCGHAKWNCHCGTPLRCHCCCRFQLRRGGTSLGQTWQMMMMMMHSCGGFGCCCLMSMHLSELAPLLCGFGLFGVLYYLFYRFCKQ